MQNFLDFFFFAKYKVKLQSEFYPCSLITKYQLENVLRQKNVDQSVLVWLTPEFSG